MIKGIGTDLVEINRITRAIERHGERFARRILSDEEIHGYESAARKDNFLAKRFAIKEAVSKALGTGIAEGVVWQNMEVSYTDLGAPQVVLSGGALQRLGDIGASTVHISISDEAGLISAFAVAS